jgi:hypothetical protein
MIKGELQDHVKFDPEDEKLISPALKANKESGLTQAFEAASIKRDISLSVGQRLMELVTSYYSRRRLGLIRPRGARRALRLAENFAALRVESPLYDPPEVSRVTTIGDSEGIPQSTSPQDKEVQIDLRHAQPGYEAALNLSD